MAKTRKAFPVKLENKILYKSARTCCICRVPRKPVEIHHIDQDPSNNVENNLVAICRNCHDEAHTTHTMSKNLTSKRLEDSKIKWEKEVAYRSASAMTSKSNLAQAVWTYLNHQRLPHVMKVFGVSFESEMCLFLQSRGVIDTVGIPVFSKKNSTKRLITIYDRLEYDDSHRLHYLYSEAIDDLIETSKPIELGAIWTKTEIKNLVSPGNICFCMRGFRFRRGEVDNNEEDRTVYARAKGIEIRLMANTRHMFGSSALYDSFVGNRFAAILMMVKNISNEKGILIISATPLAMGAGFVSDYYNTPYLMKYGWKNRVK